MSRYVCPMYTVESFIAINLDVFYPTGDGEVCGRF